MLLLEGVAEAALYCAHRTSTVSPCAFCEQEGHLAAPSPILLRPRVARARGSSQLPHSLFSILLGEIQTQESIVFGGKIQVGPVAGETRNDTAMFLAEPG